LKGTAAVLLASLLMHGCLKAEKPVQPDFTLTPGGFRELAARMPAGTAPLALADPAGFLSALRGVLAAPRDLLTLVDKTHGLSPDTEPADLVALDGYPIRLNKKDLAMRAVAAEALASMCEGARKAGIVLDVSSTYRSYAYQETLFAWNLKRKPREIVEKELAKPGHSQHQLGTVVDFGSADESFTGTTAALWLRKNAGTYGFSLSYPKGSEAETGYIHEPWHYRYLGTAAVSMILMYFEGSQQAFLAWFEAEGNSLRNALRIPIGRTIPEDPRAVREPPAG
jgi:zinc D-Ala-D-Ala carboxypeptidase